MTLEMTGSWGVVGTWRLDNGNKMDVPRQCGPDVPEFEYVDLSVASQAEFSVPDRAPRARFKATLQFVRVARFWQWRSNS